MSDITIVDPSSITTIGLRVAKVEFEKACQETKEVMVEKAPGPEKSSPNQYNMSTGATRGSITIRREGEYKAFIGPSTHYAYYAENGRRAISKGHYMRFMGGDHRWHYAKYVGPMDGWHFVEDTAEVIRKKYGV